MAKKKLSEGDAKLPVLFLLVTLGILVAGGYFVYKTVLLNGTFVPNPITKVTELAGGKILPKVQETDFAFVEDPEVRKNFVAQTNTTKFRVISNSSGRGTEAFTEVDYKSDSDVRMYTKMEQTEIITIGNTTYLKDPADGIWWMEKAKPVPTGEADSQEDPSIMSPEDFKTDIESKQNMTYKKLGEEPCPVPVGAGLTCYKYEETEAGNADSPKRTFWFDTKSYLLRKEINGYGEFTSTNEYTYDNISISAPSKTKAVPEGKSIYEMMAFGSAAGILPEGMGEVEDYFPSGDNPSDEGMEVPVEGSY